MQQKTVRLSSKKLPDTSAPKSSTRRHADASSSYENGERSHTDSLDVGEKSEVASKTSARGKGGATKEATSAMRKRTGEQSESTSIQTNSNSINADHRRRLDRQVKDRDEASA
jgi:hypothetical protein